MTDRLDLDAIEAMLKEYPDAENIRKWAIALDFAKHVPALVARVRALEGECNKMGEILIERGCDKVISELVAAHDLLAHVAEEGIINADLRAMVDEVLK